MIASADRAPVVVVGDALLDRDLDGAVERLCPDAPAPVVDDPAERLRPGGAGLAAALAASDGRRVVLVTALGRDAAGEQLASLLASSGVGVVDLGRDGATPEKVRVLAGGRSLLRVDRGGRGGTTVGPAGDEVRDLLASAAAVLVADYGRGVAAEPGVRAALGGLPSRLPVVWDPHPAGALPVSGTRLATPNRAEARAWAPTIEGEGLAADAARARALLEAWAAANVAVTLGDQGALLAGGAALPMLVPATPVAGDPCGAGDRFAATAAGLLADGALPSEAVAGAVDAAAAYVAAGGALAFSPSPSPSVSVSPAPDAEVTDGFELAARVRARGGTVVATGGCFDILHAGHVGMLQAARSLGDCLVVCVNSDSSVRRLKGPGRPVMQEADRAALLLALGCVDGVVLFDEDTPLAVLDRLRPHVFAKGGDYAGADIPEAALLSSWGGQAVVLPYLEGRSTSRIVHEVAHGSR